VSLDSVAYCFSVSNNLPFNRLKRVKRARYILIPLSDETRGHQSYNRAVLWKNHLLELLHISEPRGGPPAARN